MTLRIGIIGTGWFSKVHAGLLQQMEGVQVQSILGTSSEKADRMAADYAAKGYDQLTDMLDAEQLDAVYICVPPMSHGEIELALIERNIPFLVEKPLATDLLLPQKIEAAIREKGLLTSVGYHFRYQETVDQLRAGSGRTYHWHGERSMEWRHARSRLVAASGRIRRTIY